MNTRQDLISRLREGLGPVASTDDAELLFAYLHRRGEIEWCDRRGYMLADPEIDLIEAYCRVVEK